MKTIAVYNLKGGVGKTTTAVNLAYLCARQGFRTLIWDLDPQGAASFYFRVKPRVSGGVDRLVRRKVDVRKVIRGTDFEHLDLVPSDFSYRKMDISLRRVKNSRARLGVLLKPLKKQYDMLFVDCPPDFDLVTENVLGISDVVLIPLIPTTLSLNSLDLIEDKMKKHVSRKTQVRSFFTMVDRRKKLHNQLCDAHAVSPSYLRSRIPNASAVEKMGINRQPLHAFDSRSPAALAYEALWHEVLTLTAG